MFPTGTFGSKEPSPHPLHEYLDLGFEMVMMSLDQPRQKPRRATWVAYLRMADVPTLDVPTDPPKVDVPLEPPAGLVIVIHPIGKLLRLPPLTHGLSNL